MAYAIVVQRGAADKPGPEVVDILISGLDVALARGVAELDSAATQLQKVLLSTVYRSGVKNGQMLVAHDALQGISWNGKIVGVQHQYRNGVPFSMLTVLRPE